MRAYQPRKAAIKAMRDLKRLCQKKTAEALRQSTPWIKRKSSWSMPNQTTCEFE